MTERFADPEGMYSLLEEIQMSGERDMEMIQRAAEEEATSGALDTRRLGLEVGGDTASISVALDQGRMSGKNDGDPHMYVSDGPVTVKTYVPGTDYPLKGGYAGESYHRRMTVPNHRRMQSAFDASVRAGEGYYNQKWRGY